jgi:hypothetical protein
VKRAKRSVVASPQQPRSRRERDDEAPRPRGEGVPRERQRRRRNSPPLSVDKSRFSCFWSSPIFRRDLFFWRPVLSTPRTLTLEQLAVAIGRPLELVDALVDEDVDRGIVEWTGEGLRLTPAAERAYGSALRRVGPTDDRNAR